MVGLLSKRSPPNLPQVTAVFSLFLGASVWTPGGVPTPRAAVHAPGPLPPRLRAAEGPAASGGPEAAGAHAPRREGIDARYVLSGKPKTAVVVKTIGAPLVLVYSGDWDVHWAYDLEFDPWPNGFAFPPRLPVKTKTGAPSRKTTPTWTTSWCANHTRS